MQAWPKLQLHTSNIAFHLSRHEDRVMYGFVGVMRDTNTNMNLKKIRNAKKTRFLQRIKVWINYVLHNSFSRGASPPGGGRGGGTLMSGFEAGAGLSGPPLHVGMHRGQCGRWAPGWGGRGAGEWLSGLQH